MNQLRSTLLRHRSDLLGLRARLAYRRFLLALKFDDDQPRDERGRWVETDRQAEEDTSSNIVLAASRRQNALEAACKIQYDRDMFQCKIVGLPSCYAQAMERFVACGKGRPIPPLNY